MSRSKRRSCGVVRCGICQPHKINGEIKPSERRVLQDCDEVPAGYWSRLMAQMHQLECVEEAPGVDPEMPF